MLKAAQPVAAKMWTKQAASGQPPAPRGVGLGCGFGLPPAARLAFVPAVF